MDEKALQELNVEEKDGELYVDARYLHNKLGSNRDFSNWIKDKIERWGFRDGTDYSPILLNNTGRRGKPRIEYELTLRMAIHLAMAENSPVGMQVRDRFIEIEREYISLKRRGFVHLPNFENTKQVLNHYAQSPIVKDYRKRQVLESFLWNIGIDKNIIPSGDREHPINSRRAAWYLGVSMSTVQKYTRNGFIPHTVIFGMKRYFERDLRKLLDKGFFPGRQDENLLGFDEDETEGNLPIQ